MKRRVNSGPFRVEQKTPRSVSLVRHGVPGDVLPRQAVESSALLFPLDQPTAEVGYVVRSLRLIPGPRKKSDCLRLPREACFGVLRDTL